MNALDPRNYSLKELSAAIIAGLYLLFSALVLFTTVPVGLEEATVALVGPVIGVVTVFVSVERTPMDLQKALEALKGVAITFVSFFVAVPTSTEEQLSILIVGIVSVVGIAWARSGAVSRE